MNDIELTVVGVKIVEANDRFGFQSGNGKN